MILSSKEIVNVLPSRLREKLPKNIKVVEVSRQEVRRLNHIYRQKNKPTNVLSFRHGSDYGEILVCPAVVRREAKEQGNTYQYQMTWMILHGMLHLAGMHHERSRVMAAKIERLEQKILRQTLGH
ncbi:MAG: rRNA maturation RNase YbeY [Candidatus Sungbacteria bacterium]|nr:rRNA maturation RNase YbeY [Candidatus Sungbacteria bacterium]